MSWLYQPTWAEGTEVYGNSSQGQCTLRVHRGGCPFTVGGMALTKSHNFSWIIVLTITELICLDCINQQGTEVYGNSSQGQCTLRVHRGGCPFIVGGMALMKSCNFSWIINEMTSLTYHNQSCWSVYIFPWRQPVTLMWLVALSSAILVLWCGHTVLEQLHLEPNIWA